MQGLPQRLAKPALWPQTAELPSKLTSRLAMLRVPGGQSRALLPALADSLFAGKQVTLYAVTVTTAQQSENALLQGHGACAAGPIWETTEDDSSLRSFIHRA